MKIASRLVTILSLFAVPAGAQEQDDFDYLAKMRAEAVQYMTEADEASRAGDRAGECAALTQAIISLTSAYMTAGGMVEDMRDEGAPGADIADMADIENGFLETRDAVGQMAAGCAQDP